MVIVSVTAVGFPKLSIVVAPVGTLKIRVEFAGKIAIR